MPFSSHQQIILASGNKGKIKEIQAILSDHPIVPQSQFNIEEAEETGSTFVENAIIKARNAAVHCDSAAIVGASDQDNLLKLLKDLEGVPTELRTARFVCVIVLMRHANDPLPLIAQGTWEGVILEQSVGDNGFGYDPIFWVPSHQKASAELSSEMKNSISHRGQALAQLTQLIQSA